MLQSCSTDLVVLPIKWNSPDTTSFSLLVSPRHYLHLHSVCIGSSKLQSPFEVRGERSKSCFMAARALAAVSGRRFAGAPLLASCSRRGAQNHSSSSAQPEEQNDGTAARVEAALNRKNVEVLLPDETVAAAENDDAWVPDQETGVFVPADEASADTGTTTTDSVNPGDAPPPPPHVNGEPSVLDQTVFVREDMEDIERPAIDMANANQSAK